MIILILIGNVMESSILNKIGEVFQRISGTRPPFWMHSL